MTESNLNVNKSQKQYNYCLDFIKGLACIFVVFMHCEFPGKTGTIVQAISRFCVPLFFMVSGYFSYSEDNQVFVMGWGKRKIIHIGKIVIYASLFYLVWFLCKSVFFGGKQVSITPYNIGAFLLFNLPIGISSHLWFLFALLYVYVFYSILCRFHTIKIAYSLAVCLFVVYFILAQGAWLVGIDVSNCVYRNWLIEGFPFFMSGMWIHEHKDRITFSNNQLITIILVSSFLCLIERQIMGRDFGVNICTLPQVFALFFYAVKNPERHSGFLQRIGKDCSLLVYIMHMFVWELLSRFYSTIGIRGNIIAQYFLPILVVILSFIVALAFNWIVSKFKKEPQIVKS